MKKICVLAAIFVFCTMQMLPCFAAKMPMYKRVDKIGHKLLEANNMPTNIKFKMKKTNKINAYANTRKEIYVFSGLIKLTEDDDELAGIIAHEIGHIANKHLLKMNAAAYAIIIPAAIAQTYIGTDFGATTLAGIGMKKWSRSDEFEADITGVDLMVKAGYNPLAMVSILNKITNKYLDILSTHPSGEKRTMLIYNYICYAYPEQAKKGYESESFEEFLAYAEPIIEARKNNPEKEVSYNRKMEKLHQKRQEKYVKYQKKDKRNKNYKYKVQENL